MVRGSVIYIPYVAYRETRRAMVYNVKWRNHPH